MRVGLIRRVMNNKPAATRVASDGGTPIKNATNNPPVIKRLLINKGSKHGSVKEFQLNMAY